MIVKYKGYEAMQSDYNHHVMVVKDGQAVMHVPYDKKLTVKELRGEIERYIKRRESAPSTIVASSDGPPPAVNGGGAVKRNPLDVLIALACCSSVKLTCGECPFYHEDMERCSSWTDDELVEAVRTLRGMVDDG